MTLTQFLALLAVAIAAVVVLMTVVSRINDAQTDEDEHERGGF